MFQMANQCRHGAARCVSVLTTPACKIIYLHSVTWVSDGCLSVPDKRWHCSLDNRTGPRISPGPARHPGTMTRNFPYGRDIFSRVATARTGPPVSLSRPGDCRAEKSRQVAIIARHSPGTEGSPQLTSLPSRMALRTNWSLGLIFCLCLSNWRQMSEKKRAPGWRPRCDFVTFLRRPEAPVTCGMRASQNVREELFRGFMERRENLVSLSLAGSREQQCTERAED